MTTKREEWTANAYDGGVTVDMAGEDERIASVDKPGPGHSDGTKSGRRQVQIARARRIAAVPDCERALMEAHEGIRCRCKPGDVWRCYVADALIKSGVLE